MFGSALAFTPRVCSPLKFAPASLHITLTICIGIPVPRWWSTGTQPFGYIKLSRPFYDTSIKLKRSLSGEARASRTICVTRGRARGTIVQVKVVGLRPFCVLQNCTDPLNKYIPTRNIRVIKPYRSTFAYRNEKLLDIYMSVGRGTV